MKYLKQILIILTLSLVGEVLHAVIPFPIPASIYGIILVFVLDKTGILPVSRFRETGGFLVSLLSLLFVCPVVGLMTAWDQVAPNLGAIAVILVVSTVATFAASGLVTKLVQKGGAKHE